MNPQFVLAKGDVRRSFERAAHTYDDAAVLAREIGDRMLERLDLVKAVPQRLLDLGSGTGYCAHRLRSRYPRCTVVELDFARSMLLRARLRRPWWRRGIAALNGADRARAVCADKERLPFADRSFDMVWSNLALNWLDTPQQVFAETRRVLRPGGVFMFSTLGPDTLKELRGAYAAVDRHVHVNRFVDMHDLGDGLVSARFSDPVMDMECVTLSYADVRGLLRDLKASGARNFNAGRNAALSGKGRFAGCVDVYERLRAGGRLPATFEVVYGQAWRPEREDVRADGRAVIRFHEPGRAGAVRR
jgi:malonyl-CoA O-methyltransferase